MHNKWFIFIMFVWIIMLFFSATIEKHTTSATWEGNTQQSTLQYLTTVKNVSYVQTGTDAWVFIGFNPQYFKTLIGVLTWDFGYLQGDIGEMFRWIILIPITIGVIAMIGDEFIKLIQGFLPA